MNKICFSKRYCKIPNMLKMDEYKGKTRTVVVGILKDNKHYLIPELEEYDTVYPDTCHYKHAVIPDDRLLIILLLTYYPTSSSNQIHPTLWTTIRRDNRENRDKYEALVGREVTIALPRI